MGVTAVRRALLGWYDRNRRDLPWRRTKLLLRLQHRHDPHDRLFERYAEALAALSAGGNPEAVLRVFEKRLLEEIGFGLVLEHVAGSGAPVRAGCQYRYRPEHGPVLADGTDDDGIAVSGDVRLELAAERLDSAETLREAKRLLRALLARQLGDRPLVSRNLFRPARGADAVE